MASPHDMAWSLNWKLPIPGVSWHLTGHSMCRETTGFLIREPRIFLDAGNVAGNKTPQPAAILLTHTHFDHAGALPSLLRAAKAPTVFLPFEVTQRVRDWCRMSWAMKVDDQKQLPPAYAPSPPLDGPSQPGEFIYDSATTWVPSSPGQSFPLLVPVPQPLESKEKPKSPSKSSSGQQELFVDVVKCYHTVSTVGYILSEKRMKLKDEYKSLPGKEIAILRKQNVAVQEMKTFPLLAYICDTNVSVFDRPDVDPSSPEGITHQASVSLILQCPVVMIECTYIEDEKALEAKKRGHMIWNDLRPYTESHPEITWVLFHFSLRYKDDELRTFFQTASSQGSRPMNVVLWLDSGVDDPKLLVPKTQQ